jgi:hypothetical protein
MPTVYASEMRRSSGNTGPRGRKGKVERVIEKYDLPSLGDQLVDRWTAEEERRASLRELETDFNVRILREAMEDANISPLEGEVENMYRLLTSDDVSSGAAMEAERRLERKGIDLDELRSDFVSHQAIHTYLTKHRGVERVDSSKDHLIPRAKDTIQQLSTRTQAVAENICGDLAEDVNLGDFTVFVNVEVYCKDCGKTYPMTELLERGGCDCGSNG